MQVLSLAVSPYHEANAKKFKDLVCDKTSESLTFKTNFQSLTFKR